MMKAILVFILLCLTLGGQAQNLKMEKNWTTERKACWDSLTYRLQYGNGIYCIQDTCDAVLASAYSSVCDNINYNDDSDSCRIAAYYDAKEAWTIQCIKALPEDISHKLVQYVEQYPNLNYCMANITFDREGKVIYVSLRIFGVLFESMTEEQIERFYRTIKEMKVPLTGFYDFPSGKFCGKELIDLLNPIIEGKVTFLWKEKR